MTEECWSGLKQEFPELRFTLNGGVLTYEDIETHLNNGVAGVMIGTGLLMSCSLFSFLSATFVWYRTCISSSIAS